MRPWYRSGLLVLAIVLLGLPSAALAEVFVTRAELDQGRLKVEGGGAAPGATIKIDGLTMGSADAAGNFRFERENFFSSTCKITVSDGITTARVTLSGCTPTETPPEDRTAPETPQFLQAAQSGLVGEALSFNARGFHAPGAQLAFVFTWGDGSTVRDPATGFYTTDAFGVADSAVVSHAWSAPGSYAATATAVDDAGQSATSEPVTVVISEPLVQNDCGSGIDAGATAAGAVPVVPPVNCTATHEMGRDEVDFYRFEVSQSLRLLTVLRSPRRFGEPAMLLTDPSGATRTPRERSLCAPPPTGCGQHVARAFGFTLDLTGTWFLEVATNHLAGGGDYTLEIRLGGGGDDCASGRDPGTVPVPFDAPNTEEASEFKTGRGHLMPILGSKGVDCRGRVGGASPPDLDRTDRYTFPVTAGEVVAISALPHADSQFCLPVSDHRAEDEISMAVDGPFSPTHPGSIGFSNGLCLDFFEVALADGPVVVELTGGGRGLPPQDLGYGLQVATYSRHLGDCSTGADAPGTAATALAPTRNSSSDREPIVCIGDIGAGDAEDWYRFTAEAGERLLLGKRTPTGALLPVELFDPDGVARGSSSLTIDKPGAWRVRVATDGAAGRYEGPYALGVHLAPARIITAMSVSPTEAVGGSTAEGTVSVGKTGICHTIVLSSSNPAVADTPDAITVCSDETVSFRISTTAVSSPTTVTITASYADEAAQATFTIKPPADTVSIKRAEYRTSTGELLVEATGTNASATLSVFVAASDELIGTLTGDGSGRFKGSFSWPVNPAEILVRSSLGGSDRALVTAK